MEIYVNGEQLDLVSGQDIELNWSNIRFSEAIADEWSTDIQLSNTPNNIKILDAYGLLDRGAIFQKKIPCSIVISDIGYDAYLHVTELEKDTITAAVFLLVIPYSIYSKEIKEYFPADNAATIFRWDRQTKQTTNSGILDVAVYPYNYNSDYYSDILAQLHPSIRAQKVLEAIESNENITLPTLDNDLFLTAPKQVVCPQNKYQCFMSRVKDSNAHGGNALPLIGGQHITNDFKCEWGYKDFVWNTDWSDWVLVDTYKKLTTAASKDTITFNRSCSCRITVYGTTDRDTWDVHVYRNNEELTSGNTHLYRLPHGSWDTAPSWNISQALACDLPLVTFDEGDKLQFKLGEVTTSLLDTVGNISVLIEYISYEITDEDYNTDLNYYPMQFGLGYAWLNGIGTTTTDGFRWVSGDGYGANGFLDHSCCYYGAWANMNSCSVRDFISNLCWVHDRKLKLDKYDLSFVSAYQTKNIDGNLTKITTFTDNLGQRNKIGYKDFKHAIEWDVDNDFLENEKTVHQSIFSTADNDDGMATIEQYKYENTMSEPKNGNEPWVTDVKVTMEDYDLLLFTLADDNGYYRLEKARDLTDFGLSDIVSTVCVEIDTYDSCKDVDYVYLDGRKYLVINGKANMDNGLNTLDCIEIPTKYGGTCAAPTVVYSIIVDATECMLEYSVYDNTMSGHFYCRVYQNDTIIETYQLEQGNRKFLTITGLTPDTSYRLEIYGSNDCGWYDEDEYIRTLYRKPPEVEITKIVNINEYEAIITFKVTENQ